MKKPNFKTIISVALALVLSLFVFVGCNSNPTTNESSEPAAGGVLVLSVNPEIAVSYDALGNVTTVIARNDDAKGIIAEYSGYEGKTCKAVISELVAKIGEAGYFVEEIEGEKCQIIIEIEPGSTLPNESFLDDVANGVRDYVKENKLNSPVDVKGESDYGITDYIDTDYGPDNDGVTDYSSSDTSAFVSSTQIVIDYNDTDYGPDNDGVTDYNDTVITPDNDSATDYSDYGTSVPAASPEVITDYDDTDYGPNNDGVTDYSDYSTYTPPAQPVTPAPPVAPAPSIDANTDYDDTNYAPNNSSVNNYDDTDYGNSNYNDANTDYGNSDYDGDSDYDD